MPAAPRSVSPSSTTTASASSEAAGAAREAVDLAVAAPERLSALHASGLLSTAGAEPAFDRVTTLVRRVLGVPVAQFATLTEAEQVLLSHEGPPEPAAEGGALPLSHSLCKYVVASGSPLVVGDARSHPVVCESPAVSELGVRAYLGVPVRDPAGHVLGSLCGVDVEPRTWDEVDTAALRTLADALEAEIALRAELAERVRSEAEYRVLFEASPDAVLLLDPETEVVLDANRAACELYGFEHAAFVGTSMKRLSHDPAPGEAVTAGLLAGARRWAFESVHHRADGSPVRVAICASVVERGGRKALLSVNRDVTEQRHLEAAVHASEARYRSVVENVRDAVFQTDRAGRWSFLSPAWAAITGFHVPESLGEKALGSIHPAERRGLGEAFEALLEGRSEFVRLEARLLTRHEGYRHAEVHAQRLCDEDGRVVGVSGTVTDITDTLRFHAEREAREREGEARARAEEMLRLRSGFLNNMSHELRTPMTGILGFAALLAEENDGAPAELAEALVENARRLSDTLDAVLDLAQLESGTYRATPEPLDALAEVSDAVELTRPLAEEKGLDLTLSGPSAPVHADRALLRRTLLLLLSNAVKFTSQGRIHVELGREARAVRFRVTDTGVGIGPGFLPHVFTAFKQESEGYDREYEGNGLGLTLAKQFVELMGGTLTAESRLGVGSSFTVTLPRAA